MPMIRYFNRYSIHLGNNLVVSSTTGHAVRNVIRSPARRRVAGPAPWLRILRAPVETAGWKATPVNCLFENSRDLLRERSMFGSGPATK